VASVYVRHIATLLSIVQQHGYYHHIMMLLCSTDCNVTMFVRLQH